MTRRSATAADHESDPVWTDDAPAIACARHFHRLGDGERYLLQLVDVPIEFELDHLRLERRGLFWQLAVRTELPGARPFQDILSIGTFNVSSPPARSARAKLAADLARSPQIDWHRLIEEFATRVLHAEHCGQPSVSLRDVPDDGDDDVFDFDGVVLPKRAP